MLFFAIRKEAMKPVIEVETKNGAILCDDDVLSVLFPIGVTQCEELRAKVVKWNVPQLKERYLDACHYFNMGKPFCKQKHEKFSDNFFMNISEPSNEISTILDSTTVNLDLSNKKYRDRCIPIARALNRQTSLYELNFSGLLAGNKMVEVLCESLPSLVNLSVLNLSTNHINCDGLYTLSTTLQYTPLRSLNALDLSYNPLGNTCLKHIADLTHSLNLEKLHLCAVDFTIGVFNSSYNQNVSLSLKNLTELNVSHNELGKSDLAKFLNFLYGDKVEMLEIGNNGVETSGLGLDIFKMLQRKSQDLENHKVALRKAGLSWCMLEDDDICNLIR